MALGLRGALGQRLRQSHTHPPQIGRTRAHTAAHQVHGRAAGEAGHKVGRRAVVDFFRRGVLHLVAGAQHCDAVGQRHGFDLVVGHINDGGAQALVQFFDFAAHFVAQLRVQVGQGLVEQKHLGLAHDGAANRHALALPARERGGLALEHVVDAQQARGVHDAALDFVFGRLAQTQAKGHVVVQALVRIERVVLKHHGDVAVARRLVVDALAVDQHIAAADALQARDHAQQGGLAAARGPHKHHKLAVLDLQIDAMDDGGFAVVAFLNVLELDGCHV